MFPKQSANRMLTQKGHLLIGYRVAVLIATVIVVTGCSGINATNATTTKPATATAIPSVAPTARMRDYLAKHAQDSAPLPSHFEILSTEGEGKFTHTGRYYPYGIWGGLTHGRYFDADHVLDALQVGIIAEIVDSVDVPTASGPVTITILGIGPTLVAADLTGRSIKSIFVATGFAVDFTPGSLGFSSESGPIIHFGLGGDATTLAEYAAQHIGRSLFVLLEAAESGKIVADIRAHSHSQGDISLSEIASGDSAPFISLFPL